MEEKTKEDLLLENEELRVRLAEAEETLRAIREGRVDALAVWGPEGERIYTLEGADHPYRVLVETMNEGAVTFSEDGTILYGNAQFETMLDIPSERVVGRSFRDYVTPEDLSAFDALLEGGTDSAKGEVRLRGGKGTFHASLSLKRMSTGSARPYCIIVSDLTERKAAEDELALALAETRAYAARLELLNNELQEFAFIASHDLQEPLRKVQAFSGRLRSRCEASLGEEGRDYLRRMESAAGRMSSLLSALLAYSRVSTRGKPFAPVDLGHVAREALSDLEIAIEDADAQVEIGYLPNLEVDPDQMRQLFQNLIANAIRYRSEGERPLIRVHGSAENGMGQLLVEDNGIGFDEKYLDRIFKPFQRLHGRSSQYEGTGMGLAICRKIVERHGGSITARSIPGKGSTFVVTLPIRQTPAAGPDEE